MSRSRHYQRWTPAQLQELWERKDRGESRRSIGEAMGRSTRAVKRRLARPRLNHSPGSFAAACREIVASRRGHDAHRALDLLTNEVLRGLGYGDGIDIFEATVGAWHSAADRYPYVGPCPNCEGTCGT